MRTRKLVINSVSIMNFPLSYKAPIRGPIGRGSLPQQNRPACERARGTCRWRITKLRRQLVFGISLDNAFAIDNT